MRKGKDTATTNLNHASNASTPLSTTSAPSSSHRFFSSARRRPPPLALDSAPAMGQAESTARPPQLDLGPQPTSKLRFGWPGRRKKSEDLTRLATPTAQRPLPLPVPPMAPPNNMGNTMTGRELTRQDSDLSSLDGPPPTLQMHDLSRSPSRSSSAKQLTMQFASNTLSALKGKLNASQASLHSSKLSVPTSPTSPPPPPLPPKVDASRMSHSSSRSSQSDNNQSGAASGKAAPLPKHTPPDPSAHPTAVETHHHHPQNEIVPTATATATPLSSLEDGASPSSHAHDVNLPQRRERERREQTAKEIADDWRKSDSTLRTVRLVGSRTPRPLSLAESTNSGHTVLPAVGAAAGKRLSALMTDADFGLKEVDSEEDDSDVDEPSSSFASSPPSAFNSVHDLQQEPSKPQPATSRRGSLSIRIGRLSGSKSRVTEHGQLSGGSDSEALSSSVSTRGTGTTDMGMLTANSSTTSVSSSCLAGTHSKDPESRPSIEIASNASISSSMSSEHRPHQYAQYKANAKLDPFIGLPTTNQNASESQASLSTSESASVSSHVGSSGRHTDSEKIGKKHAGNMSSPHGPTLRPAHQRTRLQSIQARGFRQTAVSITTGFANPAAGFARKAVDKLGRALGGSSASLPTPDGGETPPAVPGHGHSSSASGSNASLFGLGMTSGQQHPLHERHRHAPHPPSSSKKAMRKHRASPSGTWSVNSSDTDGGVGPHLGRCLRGPLMPHGNPKGLVFSRDLESCVRNTACTDAVEDNVADLSLRGRSLPALVVRCAQHIVKWGVQEEGLFRISGRSTHISKLRAEFDCGADYDLRECGPGEIDPHAVASVFKTFLRELPEPLLTHRLAPYFEAALAAENHRNKDADAQSRNGDAHQNGTERMRGAGLPSNPRDSAQIRKAPSLSTFAVPTLSPHSASRTLLSAFSILIARLPKENHDVLRTVTELIMATARASRETKMPLSNLLLVFCPTLCMSPPMLRVLCEGQGIWDGPLETEDSRIPVALVPANETIAEKDFEEDSEQRRGSEESETALHHQATIKRPSRTASGDTSTKSTGNVSENGIANGPSTSVPSLVLPADDRKTAMTTGHTRTGSSVSTSAHLSSPEGLVHSSGSSDSLHTPPSSVSGSVSPTTSLVLSASAMALDTTGFSAKLMALRAQSDLPSPLSPSATKRAVRKSLIGRPVPFPLGIGTSRSAGGCSAPVTPVEFGMGALDKLSITSHSTSSLHLSNGGGAGASSTASTPSRLGRRKSKVSTLGLKTKRSLSSLLARAQDDAQATPLRSAVPDLATVQEPASSPPRSSTPCPVLNLPVDMSRLDDGLGLSINDNESETTPHPKEPAKDIFGDGSALRVPSPSPPRSSSPSPASSLRPRGQQQETTSMMMDRSESDSSAMTSNSVFYTPPTTARALAPAANNSASSSSGASSLGSGSYSFLDFNLSKSGDEDDWAKSVLQAAASNT